MSFRFPWAAPNFPLSCAPSDVSTPCHAAAMAGLRHIDGSDSSRRSGATAERRQVWRSMAPGGHGSGQSIYIYIIYILSYIYIYKYIYLYFYILSFIGLFICLFIFILFIYLFNSILFIYLFKYWFLYFSFIYFSFILFLIHLFNFSFHFILFYLCTCLSICSCKILTRLLLPNNFLFI